MGKHLMSHGVKMSATSASTIFSEVLKFESKIALNDVHILGSQKLATGASVVNEFGL